MKALGWRGRAHDELPRPAPHLVSFQIGAFRVDDLEKGGAPASIRAARVYAEGRPVRLVVRSEVDLVLVKQLVAVKLEPDAKR